MSDGRNTLSRADADVVRALHALDVFVRHAILVGLREALSARGLRVEVHYVQEDRLYRVVADDGSETPEDWSGWSDAESAARVALADGDATMSDLTEAAYSVALEAVASGLSRSDAEDALRERFPSLSGDTLRETMDDALVDARFSGIAAEDVDASWSGTLAKRVRRAGL